jgi:isopentenyl-diphosphate delta-isomerase
MNSHDLTFNERKKHHIDLTMMSQMPKDKLDQRFYYEPFLNHHPSQNIAEETFEFLGKKLKSHLWISSMTGGTQLASTLNHRLAEVAGEFSIAMGLGSCRPIWKDLDRSPFWADFYVRPSMGEGGVLLANLGLAQIEEILKKEEIGKLHELIYLLKVDGLIIHVNPLQEWFQASGDRFEYSAIESIEKLLNTIQFPLMVKEVGQGMGPESLKALMQLPLAAIELAGFGGTNFSQLESLRGNNEPHPFWFVGHTCEEMVHFINNILDQFNGELACKKIILSGGIRSFLDGHYLMNKLGCFSFVGQGKNFLERALISKDELRTYISSQVESLAMAKKFLRVKGAHPYHQRLLISKQK